MSTFTVNSKTATQAMQKIWQQQEANGEPQTRFPFDMLGKDTVTISAESKEAARLMRSALDESGQKYETGFELYSPHGIEIPPDH